MTPSGAATPAGGYPQSPLRITHDGEFYARLLTKESSQSHPSFRYYGAGPAAVPFGWESQPGTPKDASCCCTMLPDGGSTTVVDVVPAITPPPSYNLRGAAAARGRCRSGRKSKGGTVDDGGCGGGRSKYCGSSYKKLKWINVGFIAAVFRRLSPRVSSVHSSSARWLFTAGSSSVDDESAGVVRDMYYQPPASKGILCLGIRPSQWMVRFCGGRREADWP